MDKIDFWVTIDKRMSEQEGLLLWSKIEHGKEVNLMLLESQTYVFGRTPECVFIDVLRQLNDYPIQLHIS